MPRSVWTSPEMLYALDRPHDEAFSGASDLGRWDVGSATPARGRPRPGRAAALLLRREQDGPEPALRRKVRLRSRALQIGARGNWAGPSWAHGYPVAEQNLLRIMLDLSLLDAEVDDVNVVTLDDPELFRYPIAVHH